MFVQHLLSSTLPPTVTRCHQYTTSRTMRSRPMTHLMVATISGTKGCHYQWNKKDAADPCCDLHVH
jgi:hypothetical protein